MHSKTPKFDEALDQIFHGLIPHERECLGCRRNFRISEEDITLLKILRVPPPTLCSSCRNRRRLSYANYSNIYKRKCDYPGHSEMMISPVAPVMPWITYDHEQYYGDSWDPKSYGKKITDENFFNQFLEILKVIPQPGVRRGSDSPNSDYSFYGKFMKDCYYVFGGRKSEDVMFSSSVYKSRHIVDSYYPMEVDTAYENVSTAESNKCFYAYFSSNCIDCWFIYDCRNCQDCFGCVNLRNKKYCWFNEQLSKEEYQQRLADAGLGKISAVKEIKKRFFDFVKQNPIRMVRVLNSNNVSGNDIKNSKNCFSVFQTEDSENVRYANFAIMYLKNCMDTNHSGRGENLYECQNSGNSNNIKFSFAVKESLDGEYLMGCVNCQNCFGCFGLKNASYCILNKQYEKEEYWKTLDELKVKMLKEGLYGEFFPMFFSPIAYNSSLSQIIFPLSEAEAKARGLFWQPDTDADISGLNAVQVSDLPDEIDALGITWKDLVIIGEESLKPFRLIEREVEFYKQNKIALPTEAPYQRMLNRFKLLNNFQVTDEKCDSCGKITSSAYSKKDGYILYCSECYKNTFL